MKPLARPAPEPEPPPDRERVRKLLGLANDLRESGVSLHLHPLMAELETVAGTIMASYVFTFVGSDEKLTDDQLEAFTDGILGIRPCDPYGHRL